MNSRWVHVGAWLLTILGFLGMWEEHRIGGAAMFLAGVLILLARSVIHRLDHIYPPE